MRFSHKFGQVIIITHDHDIQLLLLLVYKCHPLYRMHSIADITLAKNHEAEIIWDMILHHWPTGDHYLIKLSHVSSTA